MVNDALTNEALENVTATILRLDDGEEQVGVSKILKLASKLHQVIAEGAFPDSNGELTVSLLAAGHYEVQVILCVGDMFLSCPIFPGNPFFGDMFLSSLSSLIFQVSGAGYVSSRKSIGVTCSPSDCSLCAPSIMVPLSPGWIHP